MIFGYLANMVATIPMWVTMQINQEELDVAPEGASKMKQERKETSDALVKLSTNLLRVPRAAFEKTTDETPSDNMEAAGSWQSCYGSTSLRNDSRHDQPLVASSRSNDRLPTSSWGRKSRRSSVPSADDSRFL
jgi:hypothetical protein